MEVGVREKLRKNRCMLWYTLCFFALGMIDQIRGSAEGSVQMTAANCVGIVMAAMTVPSLRWERFRHNIYLVWTGISAAGGAAALLWGGRHYPYPNQWAAGVLNIVVWGYLVLYLLREGRRLPAAKRLRQPYFWCLSALYLLLFFTAKGSLQHLWFLLVFGGFYLIGIEKGHREDFFAGLLNGIILWFFVVQTLAFAFRPYDYLRYRGMYTLPTQNGVFYMLAYSAFFCKWLYAREKGKNRILRGLYFFLAAVCISLLLLTGGRSSLMGAAAATLALSVMYEIVHHKSFYRWIFHMLLLGGCVVLTFPLVYGGVRYFPVVLHHPIWFGGEYQEEYSVRSFDPWNSERYITFEEALDSSLGRVLMLFGINIWEDGGSAQGNRLLLTAQAAEMPVTGSSPENSFSDETRIDRKNSISIRLGIYQYYLSNLNLWGHPGDGFYLLEDMFIVHAHDIFLQIAFDHGVVTGIVFLGLSLYSLAVFGAGAWKKGLGGCWICLALFLPVFVYSLTELAHISGTITWTFFHLAFCLAGQEKEYASSGRGVFSKVKQ